MNAIGPAIRSVGNCWEVRVGLGERVDGAERARQPRLGALDGARLVGLHRGEPRHRDVLKRLALMGRVPLDGLDQVRDQVVTALELDVDPAPGLVDLVA